VGERGGVRIFTSKLKLKVMTRNEVKKFRSEFEQAVAKLSKKYNGKISLGTIRYDKDGLRSTMKLQLGIEQISDPTSLAVGSKVKINHRKAPGTWTISKINRKTVIVEQDGRQVKSSMSLLVAA
tara:strand:- start:1298 stop:1669 length:372 start_codon:yes stop_codon:yes gene_type:complete